MDKLLLENEQGKLTRSTLLILFDIKDTMNKRSATGPFSQLTAEDCIYQIFLNR